MEMNENQNSGTINADSFVVLGLNHRTAPVDLREKLSFPDEKLDSALQGLVSSTDLSEGVILSTCNRVEIYGVGPSGTDSLQSIRGFLADYHHLDPARMIPHLYGYKSLAAIRHGFRVASSLDSMVVGETQITGQVKKAYLQALASHTSGNFLNRFMHRALFVAKKIRTETGIATRVVSVGSAGVELAGKIFGDLSHKRVALFGAGETGQLVLTSLKEEGAAHVEIVNRSLARAEKLEKAGMGRARSLEDLDEILRQSDVVVASLGVTEPLITRRKMAVIMAERKQRPLFFIDLGVPRNIEPSVNDLDNVYLYNIDDLKQVVEANRTERKADALKAEVIIEKEAVQFFETVLQEPPTISQLGKKFEGIRQREISRTLRRNPGMSPEDREALEKCTSAVVNRILHDPVFVLRTENLHERDWSPHHLIRKLFKLEEEE